MNLIARILLTAIAVFYFFMLAQEFIESTIRDKKGCKKRFLYSYCLINIGLGTIGVIFLICTLLIFVT